MLVRCRNKNSKQFHNYGGRGITVCERWMEFVNFLEDMGECPPTLSLERIDNNGNYEPDNCRWDTILEQLRNTRKAIRFPYNGREVGLRQAAQMAGMSHTALIKRLRTPGVTINQAMETPVGHRLGNPCSAK